MGPIFEAVYEEEYGQGWEAGPSSHTLRTPLGFIDFHTPTPPPERDDWQRMKYFLMLALGIAALGLSACAHHEPAYQSTTTSSSTTGYHK